MDSPSSNKIDITHVWEKTKNIEKGSEFEFGNNVEDFITGEFQVHH